MPLCPEERSWNPPRTSWPKPLYPAGEGLARRAAPGSNASTATSSVGDMSRSTAPRARRRSRRRQAPDVPGARPDPPPPAGRRRRGSRSVRRCRTSASRRRTAASWHWLNVASGTAPTSMPSSGRTETTARERRTDPESGQVTSGGDRHRPAVGLPGRGRADRRRRCRTGRRWTAGAGSSSARPGPLPGLGGARRRTAGRSGRERWRRRPRLRVPARPRGRRPTGSSPTRKTS